MAYGLGYGRQRLIESIVKNNFQDTKTPRTRRFTFREVLFIIQEMLREEGKTYLTERKLMYGHVVFRMFVKHLLYRNLANFDSMVLITAEKGLGKSSAGMMLAREWCKLLGIRFKPERHIAYNNADVMNKIDRLNSFEPILCDEAIRFAAASDWNRRENKALKKKLAQVRTKHLLYILCFPLKINKLEKNYLESFTNYWVDLFSRGKGVIYVKDKNPLQDSWRLKEFRNVGSYTEFTPMDLIEKKLKKHPNFWTIIKFPKPPKWLYEKYLNVRESNVYDDRNILGNVTKDDIYNALLVLSLRDIMMHDTTLSMNRIVLHIQNTYDVRLNKSVIREMVKDAKQLVEKLREDAIRL